MKLAAKVLAIAILLAGLIFLTFIWWGEAMEAAFNSQALATAMADARPTGWLIGLGLLLVDLVLPVPATGVMSALGAIYGFWLGWLIGVIGSSLAGLAGYGLVRLGGDRIRRRLASPRELDEFGSLFDRWGGLAIIGSRALPILPEVMAVLAGLAGMRLRIFLPALLAGTIPVTGLFAWWGSYMGSDAPATSMLVAIVVPLVLWASLIPFLRKPGRSVDSEPLSAGADIRPVPPDHVIK